MTDRALLCIEEGCPKRQRIRERCDRHYYIARDNGTVAKEKADKGSFTHGTSHGAKQGCDCSPCKAARKRIVDDSRNRAREAIRTGTYTGAHGTYCLRLGCRCPEALKAREERKKKARERKANQRAQVNGGGYSTALSDPRGNKVSVLHYPPRGVGLWTCDECGQVFPHRPPLEVEQQQLSA